MGGALLLFSTFAGEAAANNFSPSFCVLCTGYRIPVSCYDEMARAVSADAVFGDEYQTSPSLGHSARKLEMLVMKESLPRSSVLLVGHSRGGAVATLASLASPETRKRVCGLILVDPVDDELLTVQTALLAESNYTLEFPIMVISTPFAGESSFYNTPYKSVCAPDGRGPNSFFSALKLRASASLTLITIPSLGHLALLSSGIKSLPIAHICGDAVNSNRLIGKDADLLKRTTLDLLSTVAGGRSIIPKLAELRQIDRDTKISIFTRMGAMD